MCGYTVVVWTVRLCGRCVVANGQSIADEIEFIAGYGVFSPSRLKLFSATTGGSASGLSH